MKAKEINRIIKIYKFKKATDSSFLNEKFLKDRIYM